MTHSLPSLRGVQAYLLALLTILVLAVGLGRGVPDPQYASPAVDAVNLSSNIYKCQAGDREACDTARSTAVAMGAETAIGMTIGTLVPGDKTMLEILRWVKNNTSPSAVKQIDNLVSKAGAPNRTATQADVANHFQQNRKFWTQDPIQFNGNRVYQRNDLIDPNHVSEWTVRGQTVRGTNLERMASGRAPIGPDGNSVNLHHLTQRQDGAIAEVTQTLHSSNHGTLHMPNTVPSGINRSGNPPKI